MLANVKQSLLWSKISYIKQRLILEKTSNKSIGENLIFAVNLNNHLQCIEKIRTIRNWINKQSIHLIDDEHDQYAYKVEEVLKRLLFFSINGDNKPHLSCGPRSYAMKEILRLVGIKSRIVDVFQITKNTINSHTLIEVYDDNNKNWVLQDPDFNIEYVFNNDSKSPLSARKMLGADKEKIKFATNGFLIENEINCNNTIAHCFNHCILYRYSYDGKRSQLLATSSALDLMPSLIEAEGVDFKSYMNSRGSKPIIIKFENDKNIPNTI